MIVYLETYPVFKKDFEETFIRVFRNINIWIGIVYSDNIVDDINLVVGIGDTSKGIWIDPKDFLKKEEVITERGDGINNLEDWILYVIN